MGRAYSIHGEKRNAYRVLVGRLERKRPQGRPESKWEDNKVDIREIVWDDVDRINLAVDRDQWQGLMNIVMSLWVP
jgi:hypothetical protein